MTRKRETALWSAEELDYLDGAAECLPAPRLQAQINKLAKKNDRPLKTRKQIRQRINRLGCSMRHSIGCWDKKGVTQVFGVNHRTVNAWIEAGLTCYKYGTKRRPRYGISLRSLRKFALQQPWRLLCADRTAVRIELGEDVEKRVFRCRRGRGLKKPVVDRVTGQRWESLRQFCRQNDLALSSAYKAIVTGGTVGRIYKPVYQNEINQRENRDERATA